MNNIIWKYQVPLSNLKIFSEIEIKRSINFPHELKNFLIKTNAATPSKIHFLAGTTEHILGAILSYNKEDTDIDTVFTAFDLISDNSLVPFGIDPFGNYICESLIDKKVIFWDHETEIVSYTGQELLEFVSSLY